MRRVFKPAQYKLVSISPEQYGLAGIVFDHYGSNGKYKGIETNPTIVREIKELSRRLHFQKIRANAAPEQPIFSGKGLTGCYVDSGSGNLWQMKDGELVVTGTGDYRKLGYLLSETSYSDLVLRFDFQMSKGSNSGVALRALTGDRVGDLPRHLEVSLNDTSGRAEETGTLLWSKSGRWEDALPLDRPSDLKPDGFWNSMEIELRGKTLRVAINGRDVLTTDLGRLASRPKVLAGVSRAKGRIGFQAHTGTVRFRNIRIATGEEGKR